MNWVEEAHARGVRLWLEGDRLRYAAPPSLLDAELRSRLQQAKPEIVEALRQSGARVREVPLERAQLALLLHAERHPSSAAYHVAGAFQLRRALPPETLQRAVDGLIDRHPMLAARLRRDGDDSCLLVGGASLTVQSRTRSTGPDDLLTAYAEPFDLTRSTARIVHFADPATSTSPDGTTVLLVAHHIVMDGLSLWIAMGEILELLRTELGLGPCQLGPPPRTVESVPALDDAASQTSRRFWADALADLSPLSGSSRAGAVASFAGATVVHPMARSTLEAVRSAAASLRVSPFVLSLAACGLVMTRRSGLARGILGTAVHGREGIEPGALGYFAKLLPVPIATTRSPALSVADYVAAVGRSFEAARAHQALPFTEIIKAVATEPIDRNDPRPLVRTVFSQIKLPAAIERAVAEIDGQLLPVEQQQGQFDLVFELCERGSEAELRVKLDTALLSVEEATRLADRFERTLHALASQPSAKLAELPALPADELAALRLLERGQETGAPAPWQSIVETIAARAHQDPEALAVVSAQGRYRYADLLARAASLQEALRGHGIARGSLVAVVVDPGLDRVAAPLAVIGLGAAYLPIDPQSPQARIDELLGAAGQPPVIADRTLPGRVVDVRALSPTPSAFASMAMDPDDLAYLVFTSGSTGRPKGVRVPHRGLKNLCLWHARSFALRPEARATLIAGWGFDAAVWEIFPYLMAGASLHVIDDATRTDVQALARALAAHRITHAFLPTPICERFVDEIEDRDVPDLELVLTGGDRLRRVRSTRYRWVNNYGPTETSVVATSGDVAPGDSDPSIGRAIAGTAVRLQTPDGALAALGDPGELCIAGAGVALGYLDPAEDAGPFEEDPELGRIYRSGDRARWRPDGQLAFEGRNDGQVKVRGVRIEPGEIEAALRRIPEVRDAAVVARSSAASAGATELTGYVVTDESLDLDALRSRLAQALPPAFVPRQLVRLAALPLTANGKLDRRALPAPEVHRPAAPGDEVPETPTEKALAALWTELLGTSAIGKRSDFFASGGDSLSASSLARRIRERFGSDLRVSTVYEAPSLQALASVVDGTTLLAPPTLELGPIALEPEITAEGLAIGRPSSPERILMTGVTGFFGTFLLDELLASTSAEVVCLIRAADVADGEVRLQRTRSDYGLPIADLAGRIEVIPGDIAAPRFDLSAQHWDELCRTVDTVVHCGALVNFAQSYQALRAANVEGTRTVLRLATTHTLKAVHHCSTAGIVEAAESSGPVRETAPLDRPERLHGGYNQSKWAAESLMLAARARGIPIAIHRLGQIWGHSRTGACSDHDLGLRAMACAAQLGMTCPDDGEVQALTVDEAARLSRDLIVTEAALGKTFHVVPSSTVPGRLLPAMLRELGYPIELVDAETWLARLRADDDHPLAPFVDLLRPGHDIPRIALDRSELEAVLGARARTRTIDATVLGRCLQWLSRHGTVRLPTTPRIDR